MLGCDVLQNGTSPDLTDPDMHIAMCVAYCKGHQGGPRGFVGLSKYNCYCLGPKYKMSDKGSTSCAWSCTGAQGQLCGSLGIAMNVFNTGKRIFMPCLSGAYCFRRVFSIAISWLHQAAGPASAWAMARRKLNKYCRKVDAAHALFLRMPLHLLCITLFASSGSDAKVVFVMFQNITVIWMSRRVLNWRRLEYHAKDTTTSTLHVHTAT